MSIPIKIFVKNSKLSFHNTFYKNTWLFHKNQNVGFSGFSDIPKKYICSPFFHIFFPQQVWIMWVTLWKTPFIGICYVDKPVDFSTLSTKTCSSTERAYLYITSSFLCTKEKTLKKKSSRFYYFLYDFYACSSASASR